MIPHHRDTCGPTRVESDQSNLNGATSPRKGCRGVKRSENRPPPALQTRTRSKTTLASAWWIRNVSGASLASGTLSSPRPSRPSRSRRRCYGPSSSTSRRRGAFVMEIVPRETLPRMLMRLQMKAIRHQLRSLLDEASRSDLTLRITGDPTRPGS